MISSAIYTQIDPDHQAVFSPKVITDLLRGRWGTRGGDDGRCRGRQSGQQRLPRQPGRTVHRAGGDLVLTVPSNLARSMMTAVASKAAQDQDFHAQVEASVTRVLTLKQEAGLLRCSGS